MLPAVASNVVFIPPQQAPLVHTAILGSNVLRVPSDNVPPSVSNAQVENNSKGGANAFLLPSVDEDAGDGVAPPFSLPPTSRPSPSIQLPTTFLAQLLGQIGGPGPDSITQGILVEYEKLVALSNVKYKPSNALKPPPDLSGAFDKLLKASAPVPPPAPQAEGPSSLNAQPSANLNPANPPARARAKTQTPPARAEEASAAEAENSPPLHEAAPLFLPALSAYVAAGQRNEVIRPGQAADDAVSDIA